ncbi:TPA: fimbrial biogenesis outer membrane usher protein, partial [Escherichia coli]|nr:fimbrial biogenesis outer membrane usher protein [Escherichia coli]
MPQRHHQGHKRTPKQLALIIKRCLPMVLTGSGMLCTTANAEEYYFDPIMLETTKSGMQTTDLSRFSKKYAQLPGTYQVDIWLNKKKVSQKKITFTANAEQLLQPQFTVEQLRELGIKVDEIPALAEKDDDSVINSLEQIIPGTAAEFDFNHQRLNLSIPQIALYRDARGYVSPSRWDDGIPTLFTNYSFTGSDNRYRQGNRSQRQYLNMQNGANFGPWRLRNYSTWTRNDQTSSWNTISSYLQRDIKALKSQLLLGESATSGSIFSSYTFTGVQLASDDNMLPNSQRGFAPTVRGIANSSAIVTIRQNGYVIYQSNVPAGAFEINDLYPSSNSGDLEVTIEESDGTQRRFIQPYSSLPMMQRPGHLKYSATAGRYRADANSDSKEPEFAEATAIYGLNNTFTLYSGLLGSEDYYALGIGIGGTLGALGALSMDINRADTQFDNQHSFHGYQWRTQYIKDIPETNTNIAVSYYRYTNDGYFSFDEANTRNWDYNSRQKSEIQFNISQTIFDGVSLYASGSQQDYWGNNEKNRNISVGVSGQQWGIGYSLNYQYSRYTDQNNDRALSLNLSIPLERWLPRSRVSYQMTSQKDRPTQHEMRLDGSLLDDG